MCYEEIDRFHYIWNNNWCLEMTEELIINTGYGNQAGAQTEFSRTIATKEMLDMVVQGWEGHKWVAPE